MTAGDRYSRAAAVPYAIDSRIRLLCLALSIKMRSAPYGKAALTNFIAG